MRERHSAETSPIHHDSGHPELGPHANAAAVARHFKQRIAGRKTRPAPNAKAAIRKTRIVLQRFLREADILPDREPAM